MSAPLSDADRVVRCWTRLGITFAAPASPRSPDLERLLLDTARHLPGNPRLYTMAATWLGTYGRWVARGRLAYLVGAELEHRHAAAMGVLLETGQKLLREAPFRDAIDRCATIADRDGEAMPLFDRQRDNPALATLAEAEASDISRRWRRWARPIEPRPDALRPPRWVVAHNPDYRRRADLQGDLRCSIIETLRHDPDAGASAVELQRRCSMRSYPPLLRALDQLELDGTIERTREGVSKRVRLVETVKLVPMAAAG